MAQIGINDSIVDRLADSYLFRGVPRSGIELVYDSGNLIQVSEGDRIIEEGRVPQKLYILLSGEMEVILPDPANRSAGRRMATLRVGDCFGEYGFIDRRPASATVKAVRAADVFVLPLENFDRLIKSDLGLERVVYRNLLTLLVDRLRASNVLIDMLR
jgi:serine/threonine-protein kinase